MKKHDFGACAVFFAARPGNVKIAKIQALYNSNYGEFAVIKRG